MKLVLVLVITLMNFNAWSADGGSCSLLFGSNGLKENLILQFYTQTETYLPSEISAKQDKKIGKVLAQIEKQTSITEFETQQFVNKLLQIKYGKNFQLKNLIKLSKDERLTAHLDRIALEKILNSQFLQAFKDQSVFTDKPSAWRKIKSTIYSPAFGITTMGIAALLTIKAGLLPFLPQTSNLKIEPQDLLIYITYGSRSPQGQQVLNKYRYKFNARENYDVFKKTFNVLALGVLQYVAYSETIHSMEVQQEVQRQQAEQSFETYMSRFTALAEQKPVTKLDITFDVTVEAFKKENKRDPTEEELQVLRSVVYGD
jgi:hypothetical protein